MRRAIVVSIALAFVGVARANPEADRPNAIYAEALGKGGAWGVGYDYQLTHRFALGAVVSFAPLDGQRLYTFAPYFAAYVLGGGHHHWFADAGPLLEYLQTPSPVPEWKGMSSYGIGGQLSTGYEYRDHFLFRIYGEVIDGHNGVKPWAGISIGWTF